jgi:hypothetical protein
VWQKQVVHMPKPALQYFLLHTSGSCSPQRAWRMLWDWALWVSLTSPFHLSLRPPAGLLLEELSREDGLYEGAEVEFFWSWNLKLYWVSTAKYLFRGLKTGDLNDGHINLLSIHHYSYWYTNFLFNICTHQRNLGFPGTIERPADWSWSTGCTAGYFVIIFKLYS